MSASAASSVVGGASMASSLSAVTTIGGVSVPSFEAVVESAREALATSRQALTTSWTWIKNNKKTVAAGAGVVALIGAYGAYRKVQPMLAQLREELRMMEQLASQLNPQSTPAHKHAILIHRLEHNLSVGDLTLRQFASAIRADLMSRFDVDEIRSRLRKSSSQQSAAAGSAGSQQQSEEQRLLWDEFKVAGFARTLSAAHVLGLLHALVKLQVSIVSRYVLVDQQALAARQEAEAAEAQASGQPAPPQNPLAPPSGVLSTAACEEVNRVYFSMSKHACGAGANMLADAVAAAVRIELAEQPVAATISSAALSAALTRIRARIESDALGVAEEEVEGEQGAAKKEKAFASATGASPTTTTFVCTAPYARYLLPTSDALTSLVGSTTFPDASTNALAAIRLAEMVAETNAVLATEAFACTVRATTHAVNDLLVQMLNQATFNQMNNNAAAAAAAEPDADAPPQTVPFANALVSMIKLFPVLVPDVSGAVTPQAMAAAASVSSPLFHILSDLPAVKELCAVIYLPTDAIAAPPAEGQQSTLRMLTDNKAFAGSGGTAATNASTARTPLQIEEVRANENTPAAAAAAAAPTAAQLQHAVQGVKGLPVFDRL